MNNVCLVGRLTKDPELRTTQSQLSTTTFTLAVDSGRKDENNKSLADFINVVAWRTMAENLCKYCSKGSLISVQGKLCSRSYDAQDGSKRYVTEVVANNITFLSSKNSGQQNGQQSVTQDFEDEFANVDTQTLVDDDELPF